MKMKKLKRNMVKSNISKRKKRKMMEFKVRMDSHSSQEDIDLDPEDLESIALLYDMIRSARRRQDKHADE